MSNTQIFAGTQLSELRKQHDLTQKQLAERLGISLPYLNQMERDRRPLTDNVMAKLDEVFELDINSATNAAHEKRLDAFQAMAQAHIFERPLDLAQYQQLSQTSPHLAQAILDLHADWTKQARQIAELEQCLGARSERAQPTAWEETAAFFQQNNNYFDPLDRAAEALSAHATRGQSLSMAALSFLGRHGVTVHQAEISGLRRFDPKRKRLTLARDAPQQTRDFQLFVAVAELGYMELINELTPIAASPSITALIRLGLMNYFAAAAMMPYVQFLEGADATRHDMSRLATRFGASIEQVAHRLCSMQRPNDQGIPFFFLRVDQAGNVIKHFSATPLNVLHVSRTCPKWVVHQAFRHPSEIICQPAETPSGERYFCMAANVTKPKRDHRTAQPIHAIGLGCEIQHSAQIVYADGINLNQQSNFEPIGVSCVICPRTGCDQRAAPPIGHEVMASSPTRGILPYSFT